MPVCRPQKGTTPKAPENTVVILYFQWKIFNAVNTSSHMQALSHKTIQ